MALSTAATACTALGCRGRPRSWDLPLDTSPTRDDVALLELDLGGGLPEKSSGGLFSLPAHDTFDVLVAALHQAQKRKEIKGLFLSFGAAGIGWARAHELSESLLALKKKNGDLKVSCHADAWDNTSYAAAARACDVISMSPGGEVEATGPAASVPYARELLEDKLHAQVDILQVGKFKGAAEPLTRDGPSDEYKQSIERALSAIAASNHDALAARGVADLIGTGPWAGQEAVDKKLVDVLEDKRAARDAAKKDAGGVPVDVVFGDEDERSAKPGLLDLLRIFAQRGTDAVNKPNVRLLRLDGEISLSGGGGLLGGSSGIDSRKLVEQLRRIANDGNVKAVVLRIDSPGGSALGSDLVWLAVKEVRDKKPVIVSVGEMAASGGYYIASAANTIYAEPESIVGSVGVVGGKIAFGGTLSMIGIHTASFGDKRAAQLGSLSEPWDDDTKARLQGSMETIYKLFLERVSEGRGQPKEKFENAVEGRVFGGQQAMDLGLVDDVGGLSDALAAAKKAGGLSDDAPVVTDEAQGIVDLLDGDDDTLAPHFGSDALAPMLGGEALVPLPADASSELGALRDWALSFVRVSKGCGVAAMLPAPLILR